MMAATNDKGKLAGRVVFVTGAGTGIGRASALALAREGAHVVVSGISEHDLQETARMVEEADGRALAVRCDVTRAEDVKAALSKTIETFGRLDLAFNNAGVEQPVMATADLTEDVWDRIREYESPRRVLVHEGRAPLDAGGWRRRNREHLLGRRGSKASKAKAPMPLPNTA